MLCGKALFEIALCFHHLRKVGLAVENALQRRVVAQGEDLVTLHTPKAGLVKVLLVCRNLVHRVHHLIAHRALGIDNVQLNRGLRLGSVGQEVRIPRQLAFGLLEVRLAIHLPINLAEPSLPQRTKALCAPKAGFVIHLALSPDLVSLFFICLFFPKRKEKKKNS